MDPSTKSGEITDSTVQSLISIGTDAPRERYRFSTDSLSRAIKEATSTGRGQGKISLGDGVRIKINNYLQPGQVLIVSPTGKKEDQVIVIRDTHPLIWDHTWQRLLQQTRYELKRNARDLFESLAKELGIPHTRSLTGEIMYHQ